MFYQRQKAINQTAQAIAVLVMLVIGVLVIALPPLRQLWLEWVGMIGDFSLRFLLNFLQMESFIQEIRLPDGTYHQYYG